MQVVCPKCNGNRVYGRRKKTCDKCSGLGYVTDDKVTKLNIVTTLDSDVDTVLTEALGKLDSAIIIGYDKKGNEYFVSSVADGGKVNWLLDRVKHKLMRVADK